MSYFNKAGLTSTISVVALILALITFVGVPYLPEAQGMRVFTVLGIATPIFAALGFLLNIEAYRKTQNAQALIGLLIGGGMLIAILVTLLSPWLTV